MFFIIFFLDFTNCLTLLAVTFLLREHQYSYLEFGDNLIEPRIKCSKIASVEDSLVYLLDADAVFDVMVENEIIAHQNGFINVLAIIVASYYDFNIEYRTKLNGTLTFIQKFFLKIKDEDVAGIKSKVK